MSLECGGVFKTHIYNLPFRNTTGTLTLNHWE